MAAEAAPPGPLRATLRRWPQGVVRWRWAIILFWAGVAVLLLPGAEHVENRLEVAARMPSGQAQAVRDDLARRFRSPFTDRVLLVAEGLPGPTTPEGREALETIVRAVRDVPGVAGTLSSLDTRDPIFAGKDGGFLIVVGLDAGKNPVESLLPGLRKATEALAAGLKPANPKVWLGWTGEVPLNFDLRIASAADARYAETRVLPLTLILLLLAFGGVVAAVLPLGVGVLSIALSLGVAAFLARYFTISILIQSLSSMIGLGLGIDYALLTVSRFRESLSTGQSARPAAEEAARRAGWTILLSAFPVSIGFAALLVIPLSELRSVGFAGLLVTVFSLLLSVTLLPAILSMLGPRIDALRIRRKRPASERGGSEAWRQWGHRVTKRPVLALVLASAPLLCLAAQATPARHGDAARRLASQGLGVRPRVPHAGLHGPLERHALAAGRPGPSARRQARHARGLGGGREALRGAAQGPAGRARAVPARSRWTAPTACATCRCCRPPCAGRSRRATAARRSTRSFRPRA